MRILLVFLFFSSFNAFAARPFFDKAAWTGRGENPNDDYGFKVYKAGDVNGDGYDDVLVSAPGFLSNTGKVYLYYGGPKGLSSKPAWTAVGEAPIDGFGKSMGGAGDLNGDGYDDIYIASPDFGAQFKSQGKLYVYYGGPKGPGDRPDWSRAGTEAFEIFGDCSSPIGDINSDGYDDLIVGAYGVNKGAGRVQIYLGSAQGLSKTPFWQMNGEKDGDNMGYSHGRAGDVNGDGIDDFLVGAKFSAEAYPSGGKAWLFYGPGQSAVAKPAWIGRGESIYSMFAARIYTAGDVNGDGYDDVIAGAPGFALNCGKAYLFNGSAAGLSSSPSWSYVSPDRGDRLGHSVNSAGDVNGDGYDDVLVGMPGQPGSKGKAALFFGSKAGLSSKPDWQAEGKKAYNNFGMWVASAGDVNGDGYDDVLIGEGGADGNKGKAYLYMGH